MGFGRILFLLCSYLILSGSALQAQAPAPASGQTSPPSSASSASPKPVRKSASAANSRLDPGTASNGTYRNPTFGFTYEIPAGWVLRTEELNSQGDQSGAKNNNKSKTAPSKGGRVLLAAFSRPPQARAEDVNASILIAAENVSAYPGLQDAAQYFGPLTEVAQAQGFESDGDAYGFTMGAKTLARGDFHKDVGTRVMRQSTLVMLARGYVVSFTFIGGTDDEVDELIQGLSFAAATKRAR